MATQYFSISVINAHHRAFTNQPACWIRYLDGLSISCINASPPHSRSPTRPVASRSQKSTNLHALQTELLQCRIDVRNRLLTGERSSRRHRLCKVQRGQSAAHAIVEVSTVQPMDAHAAFACAWEKRTQHRRIVFG